MPKKRTVELPPISFGNETLGQRLARLRKERGFTQVQIAEKIGLIQTLISDYETDRLKLSAEMAVRFSMALGISIEEVLHPDAQGSVGKKPSRRVLRRLEQIETLPRRKQEALLTTIDTFIAAAAK
jgi:transcriptional regulator with XRE-family HTH domain